jgi:hypothetical protein
MTSTFVDHASCDDVAGVSDEGLSAIVHPSPAHPGEVQRLFIDGFTDLRVKRLKVLLRRVLAELLAD